MKEHSWKLLNLLARLQNSNLTLQPFIVTTDASNYAVGAVLSQGQIGKDLPIAFTSRVLAKPGKANANADALSRNPSKFLECDQTSFPQSGNPANHHIRIDENDTFSSGHLREDVVGPNDPPPLGVEGVNDEDGNYLYGQ